MATISTATNEKVYSIPKWLGLNEHPDGDTRLKLGEASKMVNWKITRDGNLKRRQGQEFVAGLCDSYHVRVSTQLTVLYRDAPADEIIEVYTSATAMYPPGKITLYGNNPDIHDGVHWNMAVEVEPNYIRKANNIGMPITTEGGVATVATVDRVPIGELGTYLAALGEGVYAYVDFDEAPYAINASCLRASGSKYTLGGYRLDAVPDSATPSIKGMWAGIVGGENVFLAACDGAIWRLRISDYEETAREKLGEIQTDKGVNFIPFNNTVYIQNGYEYYMYNGEEFQTVSGYVPLIMISIGPLDTDTNNDNVNDTASDAGDLTGENINRLNGKRRIWISPDGTNKVFKLPEGDLASIDYVRDLAQGRFLVKTTEYTVNLDAQTVTFVSTPAKAVNAYEIAYTVNTTYRSDVTGNLYCEIFSGSTDTTLFLYGDGTNRAIYSGMDYNGQPRADYFPDQYELRVGDDNTPITSLIRHYSVLMAYKTNSAWAISYSITQLATGDMTPALYITPVNKDIGNAAPAQVRLVENNPLTCSGSELYHWRNTGYYTSQLSRDERQAQRISDRVQRSIKEIDFKTCCMWDDNDNQEFYISGNGITLVWNYVVDAWYRYEGLNAVKMCNYQGEVYIGTSEGRILKLSDSENGDEGYPILAEWESGAMDFGASHMRKYSSMLWLGLKPEKGTSVDVCVITDRKNTFKDKIVSSEKAKVKGEPFMTRSKIKAKKFVFYRLLLSVNEKMPAVTVTNVDFRVRQTGYAK